MLSRVSAAQRSLHIFVASVIALTLVVCALEGYNLWRLRLVAIENQLGSAAQHAGAFEEHLTQTLSVVDIALTNLSERDDMEAALPAQLRNARYLRSISQLDAAGRVVASSEPRNVNQQFDRSVLLPVVSGPLDLLRIGPLTAGRDLFDAQAIKDGAGVPPQSFIAVQRDVVQADGSYTTMLAVVNPDYFLNYYGRGLDTGVADVELYRLDGGLLLSTAQDFFPGNKRHALVMEKLIKTESGRFQEDLPSVPSRLVGYRVSRHFPLVVVVRFDANKALAAWRREATSTLVVLLAVLVLTLSMLLAYFRRGQRLAEERETSIRALNNQKFALDQHAIVSITDPAGLMTYANDRFCGISGYGREELIGQAHRVVKSGFHTKEFFETLWHTLSQGQVWRGEMCNRKKTGELYWVSASIVPLLGPGDLIQAHIAIQTDITEHKRSQDEILRLNASLEERVQQRTEALHNQQEKLQQTNEELKKKNELLAEQKVSVDHKNREIEAAKQTLEERAEQLALSSKYKSDFLSNMSHELRTPLNSLLILSQLLAENDEHNMSETQIEYAKIINGSGMDLLALINDILDLSKIESGTVVLGLQDELFANVHEQIERTFRHVALSRGIGFDVELAPSLPPALYTDSQRLQQVLKNLLSNAFKFTEKGCVSVRIVPMESGWSIDHDGLNRAGAVIGFFVTDTGIGLPAAKQKIIFEAFQQADTGTARKYGGTGLGLSISREIARLLGGELQLAISEPGQGSTFVLYLPLRAPESGHGRTSVTPDASPYTPAAQVVAQEKDPKPCAADHDRAAIKLRELTPLIVEDDARIGNSLANKKVLLVDDDIRNIFCLTALLERHKMGVVSAENGRDALEELRKNQDVHIVLMDIMMPEMDGFETMSQIRKMKQFESLPIIALTANAMKDDRNKCIAAGASDYVSKPVDTDQLVSLLRVWLYQ